MSMTIFRPGLLTTIQDLGRTGYLKYGVIVSGPMDEYAHRMANLLVGNDEKAALLEMTFIGPTIQFTSDQLIAMTGGDLSPTIDGHSVPMYRPVFVKKGAVLSFGRCKTGCRSYLAIGGGIDVPKVMNSRSTYLRAKIGGFQGRALVEGDELICGAPPEQTERLVKTCQKGIVHSFATTKWSVVSSQRSRDGAEKVVRVTVGSHYEQFSEASQHKFFSETFQVTSKSDRMGYRLKGPTLERLEEQELISEPISVGTIQVPADGNPIILMADRQTTGGYPRIAHVIAVDLPIIAQAKPGAAIRFQQASLKEAERLYIRRAREFNELKTSISLQTR
ncbi:biotin-dependent carboxyltransferase family protein [Halalkalibacterium halodurans]|uniref:KipI antagonist n=1 Tax=Halalkalibacterium halodurans TaxID=86665 RepID=A0A0M0KK02_ALKHA|nr:biotin-dependent carboxyltransferase family protein [Halalkalibacterium halodurans]TPE70935.1 biotin-dependent carboxyltransferase family protein [Halalkalibacterium halodurans]